MIAVWPKNRVIECDCQCGEWIPHDKRCVCDNRRYYYVSQCNENIWDGSLEGNLVLDLKYFQGYTQIY